MIADAPSRNTVPPAKAASLTQDDYNSDSPTPLRPLPPELVVRPELEEKVAPIHRKRPFWLREGRKLPFWADLLLLIPVLILGYAVISLCLGELIGNNYLRIIGSIFSGFSSYYWWKYRLR